MGMKNIIKIIIGIVIVGVVALLIGINRTSDAPGNDRSAVTSFDECAAAGYPVLDSYPEQCETPDGLRFVRMVPDEEIDEVRSSITVRGTFTCLPHWDTSGPQTLECAFGLLDDSGNYYVLRDTDENYANVSSVPTDSYVEISGSFIPGSSDRYQSIGTVEVESVIEL